jgi:hypothetical protein
LANVQRREISKKGDKRKGKQDDLSEFAPGAYWKSLAHNPLAIVEPINPTLGGKTARAPTLPVDEVDKERLPKHNFSHKFERATFTGTKRVLQYNINGSVRKDRNGTIQYDTVPRTKGQPKTSFLKKHNLTKESHPTEFFKAFMPLKLNAYRNRDNAPYLSVAQCQQWTNLKALLANAGTDDCYKDFVPFTVKEVQQQLGLYILNGLSPSPTIDSKFDTAAAVPRISEFSSSYSTLCLLHLEIMLHVRPTAIVII